jgi:hypothetical protein
MPQMTNRRAALLLIGLAVVLASCADTGASPSVAASPISSAAATRHPYPDATGTVVGSEPVFHAASVAGYQFLNPGAAILVDGTYHLFALAFGQDTDPRAVHLTSPDGVSWSSASDATAWGDMGLGLAAPGPIPTSVLVARDGSWVLYGWGFRGTANPAPTVAWRATAPGPDGPWTASPGVILEPAEGDAWDGQGIFGLSVIPDGDAYRMIYTASSKLFPNKGVIGMATSIDGIAWTKFNRPTATRELAASDPIISAGLCGDYDAGSVGNPQIVRDGTGYRVLYLGFTIGRGPTTIAAATSSDGATWTCAGAALTQGQVTGSDGIVAVTLIRGDERHAIVEALDAGGTTSSLWLAEL